MSNNEKTFTHYRIGDFAKYLGVTSDFLKHYEEAGLIDVVQRASGYRYYPFNLDFSSPGYSKGVQSQHGPLG